MLTRFLIKVRMGMVADAGWTFSVWGGDLSGSVNPETIVMDGDKTVYVYFAKLPD